MKKILILALLSGLTLSNLQSSTANTKPSNQSQNKNSTTQSKNTSVYQSKNTPTAKSAAAQPAIHKKWGGPGKGKGADHLSQQIISLKNNQYADTIKITPISDPKLPKNTNPNTPNVVATVQFLIGTSVQTGADLRTALKPAAGTTPVQLATQLSTAYTPTTTATVNKPSATDLPAIQINVSLKGQYVGSGIMNASDATCTIFTGHTNKKEASSSKAKKS